MTRGLRRAGALEPLYDTKEPLKALRNLSDLPNEGIYLMKDLYRSLGDAAVVRTLQDLARAFSHDRRAIVLTARRRQAPSRRVPRRTPSGWAMHPGYITAPSS